MEQDTGDMTNYCILLPYLAVHTVNSIFGIYSCIYTNIWGCFKHFQLDSTFWHSNLTNQLYKSLCKSNETGANEGKCYASLEKYLLHNVHAFNSRYFPASTP